MGESTCESLCLGANIHVDVGVWEGCWADVGESTCESVCLGADIHVNVGVWEGCWTDVGESTCGSVCLGANIHVNVCFVNDVGGMCANLRVNLWVWVQI